MIRLDNIDLDSSMIWVDKNAYSGYQQTRTTDLSGNPVIYTKSLDGGRPITLQSNVDTGWLRGETINQLRELAKVPSNQYTLIYFSLTFNVVFNYTQGDPIDFSPIRLSDEFSDSGYFVGSLRLSQI